MSINLLPWRLQQHRQRSRRFIGKLILWVGLIAGIVILLQQLSLQREQQIQQLQAISQQQQAQLSKLNGVISKLRANRHFQQAQASLSIEQYQQSMTLVAQLPLQQGELREMKLTASQLNLSGRAESQAEFEQINQFLQQNSHYEQINLSEFKPSADGRLGFQFELLREKQNE